MNDEKSDLQSQRVLLKKCELEYGPGPVQMTEVNWRLKVNCLNTIQKYLGN